MAALAGAGQSYALLADGTTLTIRPAGPEDYEPVKQLHEAMSPDNLYFRFFSASRASAEWEARRVCLAGGPGLVALLGLLGDEVVGVASYQLTADAAAAELALAVADNMHRHGIATLLLEHLVSLARARGVKDLVADVMPDNYAVLRIVSDAGLSVQRKYANGVVELSMPVPRNAALGEASTWLDAVAGREKQADVASLESLLAPRSAAVVGAGHRPGSVGRTILLNIRDAGFAGPLYAVSPHGGDIEGIGCVRSVAELPEAPDLAVLAVPAARVVAAAEECGRRGIGSLVVITSGLTPSQESDLLEATRRGSMRLVGPSSFGVGVPGIGLEATFGVPRPSPGHTGLVVQSGAVGAALVEQFSRLGIGISSVVSIGDKLDVSDIDMLLWWEADDTTKLAVIYLESFGHPRRFARTARRVTAKIPVLTVHAGRSAPGQRAAASHTAAAAAPLITRQALFEQAGIIATTGFGELLDAAVLMASQPIPAGRVVAIVSNGGGAGVLAADACAEAGLAVATTTPGTRSRLREVLPAGSALAGPVDTTDAVSVAAFREALHLAAAQDGVDAVIAMVVRRGPADLIPVLTAGRWPVPVAAVVLGQPEAIRLLPGPGRSVPAYAYPEAAARALARAARYGSWRSRPAGTVPELGNLRAADAQSIIDSFLARMPGGGWLSAGEADDLIHSIRAAPALLGQPGRPTADIGAVRDTLLRVSRLADDLPQVAELDLNPVIARPDGVIAVDARIRVTSHHLADPFLRQLPSGSRTAGGRSPA